MYCIFKLKGGNKTALIVAAILLAAAIIVSLLVPDTQPTVETEAAAGDYTLIIDPGHGGIDGGALSADGTKESNINLAIALKLRALAEFYGQDNVMTRQDDSSMSSTENYSEHDDLVKRAGPQVIYSAGADSESLGKLTHQNLISSLYPDNRRVAEPASSKLYVLNHVSCPAILVECGFMSNLSDMERLSDNSYQTTLSTVLMASFLQYKTGLADS